MSAETRIALGKRIKELRHSNNLSQKTLALMTNVERSYLAKLESGKRNPGFDLLERISDGFGITLAELLDGIQEPKTGNGPAQDVTKQQARSSINYRHVDI